MEHVFPLEWREEGRDSPYPFADGVSFVSRTGQALPGRMIVDAAVYPAGGTPPLFLSRVDASARSVTLWVGDDADDELASATYDPADPPESVALVDAGGVSAGALVLDPVEAALLRLWPPGEHPFDAEAARLCPAVTLCLPRYGVSAVELDDGVVLTGDVWLVGDRGVVLSADGGAVRADVVGDALAKRRRCEGEAPGGFVTPNFVRTINGLPPDGNGEFTLVVGVGQVPDNILRIHPQGGLVRVEVVGQTLAGVV